MVLRPFSDLDTRLGLFIGKIMSKITGECEPISIAEVLERLEDRLLNRELEALSDIWDGLSYAERYGVSENVTEEERTDFSRQHGMTFEEGVQFRQERRDRRKDEWEEAVEEYENTEETI